MNVTYYLEKTTMVTKLKDLRMKRNASLINEEDDRLRKPQHLSKTESDVLVLLYILESDDAKRKNWKLRSQSFTTLKKDLCQSKNLH